MTQKEEQEKWEIIFKNKYLIIEFLKLGEARFNRDSLMIMNDLYAENELIYIELLKQQTADIKKAG